MQFGDRVRELREQFGITQKELAQRLNVNASYVNKVEKGRLQFAGFPSAKFIHRLAAELNANEDELLGDKVPGDIRRRIRERPEAFRLLAGVSDSALNAIIEELEMNKVARR
ncbi:MAG: helix-turn-helix transcriptional regulator [Planctomycetaceae bacterium]